MGCTGYPNPSAIVHFKYINTEPLPTVTDVSFIHKYKRDERATMMQVWPACVL